MGTTKSLDALRDLPASTQQQQAVLHAAYALEAAGKSKTAKTVFEELLADESLAAHHRSAALRGLLLVAPKKGMDRFWTMLKDEDQGEVALNVLGGMDGTPALVSEIVKNLDIVPSGTQTVLLAVLGGMKQPEARTKVLDYARHSTDPAMKSAAVNALGEIPGNEAVVQFLCTEAIRPDNPHGAIAHRALVNTPGDTAQTEIIRNITATTGAARIEYIEVATRRGLKAAVPALLKSAQNGNPVAVQHAAYEGLASIGPADTYSSVISLAIQSIDDVRETARNAVIQVGRRVASNERRYHPIATGMRNGMDSTKAFLLPVLTDIGDQDSLATVKEYAQSNNNALRNRSRRQSRRLEIAGRDRCRPRPRVGNDKIGPTG